MVYYNRLSKNKLTINNLKFPQEYSLKYLYENNIGNYNIAHDHKDLLMH